MSADPAAALWLLAALLVGAGVVGLVLPALPGAPLVYGGLLLAARADGFERVSWPTLVPLALLTLLAVAIDFVAPALGAKRLQASRLALAGATLGTVAALPFGLPGLVLGPLAGAVAGEYWTRRDLRRAGQVGLGTWLGLLLAVAAKLALVFLMIGWFALAYVV